MRTDFDIIVIGAGHAGADCAAVLQPIRNWCLVRDWLEDLTAEVTLPRPPEPKASAEAKIKTGKTDATTLAHLLRPAPAAPGGLLEQARGRGSASG